MLEYGVPGSGECAKPNHKPSPVFFFQEMGCRNHLLGAIVGFTPISQHVSY
jgi:hypothetical protein